MAKKVEIEVVGNASSSKNDGGKKSEEMEEAKLEWLQNARKKFMRKHNTTGGGSWRKIWKIFWVLSEMRGKIVYYNPKKSKNHAKVVQNADKMPSKFKNRPLKTLFEIWNRDLKTLNPKP